MNRQMANGIGEQAQRSGDAAGQLAAGGPCDAWLVWPSGVLATPGSAGWAGRDGRRSWRSKLWWGSPHEAESKAR